MACKSCKERYERRQRQSYNAMYSERTGTMDGEMDYCKGFPDDKIVRVRLLGKPTRRRVQGTATKRFYGYHHAGDEFEMHIDDYNERHQFFEMLGYRERQPQFTLSQLPGIGEKTAAELDKHGIRTKEDLWRFGKSGMKRVLPKFPPTYADMIFGLLDMEFGDAATEPVESDAAEEQPADEKEPAKNKASK